MYLYVVTRMASCLAAARGTAPISRQMRFHNGPWVRSPCSVMNTLAGALIMGLINNGVNLMEVNAYWQKVALGIIIVLAVALDMFRLERATNRD